MSWSLCLPRWPHRASLVCFCFVPVSLSLSRHSAWEEPSASPSLVCLFSITQLRSLWYLRLGSRTGLHWIIKWDKSVLLLVLRANFQFESFALVINPFCEQFPRTNCLSCVEYKCDSVWESVRGFPLPQLSFGPWTLGFHCSAPQTFCKQLKVN